MNPKIYSGIIQNICSTLSIKPDDTLIRNVVAYVKSLNYARLQTQHDTDELLTKAIADSYVKSIKPEDESLDYSNYLKETIKEKKATTDTDKLIHWVSEFMPTMASKSMSIYMDSRIRNTGDYQTGRSITDFVFSLVPRQTRAELGDGRIQISDTPSYVTYFKIGSFVLPYSDNLMFGNFSKEITLTFTALRANGILARDDTYHFTFYYTVNKTNANLIDLVPTNEYCKFSPPLRILDDISLRFNDPIYPMAFRNDRLRPSDFNYLTSDGQIIFEVEHNLSDGEIIVIMGLKTLNDAANSNLLSVINNPRGIAIEVIDGNTISTGINFENIVSPDDSSKPWILFYNRTFRFPIEIGYQGELN